MNFVWFCHVIVPKALPCSGPPYLYKAENRAFVPPSFIGNGKMERAPLLDFWSNCGAHDSAMLSRFLTSIIRHISSLLSRSKCHLQHGNGDYAPHPINQVAHRADSDVMKWTPLKTYLDARIYELRVQGTMVSWNRWALIRVCICSRVNGASPDSG